MSNIKCYQLISGQDIMGDITDNGTSVTIREPAAIHMVPSQTQQGQFGIALMPYAPYAEFNKITVNKHAITAEFDPAMDLLNNYNKLFGSGIEIANVMPR